MVVPGEQSSPQAVLLLEQRRTPLSKGMETPPPTTKIPRPPPPPTPPPPQMLRQQQQQQEQQQQQSHSSQRQRRSNNKNMVMDKNIPPRQKRRRLTHIFKNTECLWMILGSVLLYGISFQLGVYLVVITSQEEDLTRGGPRHHPHHHSNHNNHQHQHHSPSRFAPFWRTNEEQQQQQQQQEEISDASWAAMWEKYNQPIVDKLLEFGDVNNNNNMYRKGQQEARQQEQERRERRRFQPSWEEEIPKFPRPTQLKLSKPIINVGFPKAGTSSIFSFFHCNGLIGQHWYCCEEQTNPAGTEHQYLMSRCILENLSRNHFIQEYNSNNNNKNRDTSSNGQEQQQQKNHILEGCGEYDFYSELNGPRQFHDLHVRTLDDNGNTEGSRLSRRFPRMIFPQHHYLKEIHDQYPNATFLLNLRPTDEWIRSVLRWGGGGPTALKEEFINEFWYQDQFRNFTTFTSSYYYPRNGDHSKNNSEETYRYQQMMSILKERYDKAANPPSDTTSINDNKNTTTTTEDKEGEDTTTTTDIRPRSTSFFNMTLTYIMEYHTKFIRNFVKHHPSHTLIEIDITKNDTGTILADAFGLHEECWEHRNAFTGRFHNHDHDKKYEEYKKKGHKQQQNKHGGGYSYDLDYKWTKSKRKKAPPNHHPRLRDGGDGGSNNGDGGDHEQQEVEEQDGGIGAERAEEEEEGRAGEDGEEEELLGDMYHPNEERGVHADVEYNYEEEQRKKRAMTVDDDDHAKFAARYKQRRTERREHLDRNTVDKKGIKTV